MNTLNSTVDYEDIADAVFETDDVY